MPHSSVLDKFHFTGLLSILALLLLSTGCGEEIPVEDPKTVYTRSMNISRFVYRDDNRNGKYDMADRPYAGQPMILSAPDGRQAHVASNLSGFTNFKMSLNNPAHPIREPGRYELRATPLDGMVFTAADTEVEIEIEALPDSPGGLIASRTLQPLGVAPTLLISGRVVDDSGFDQQSGNSAYTAIAKAPDGRALPVTLQDAEEFVFPATPGRWEINITRENQTRSRVVDVVNSPVRLSAINIESPGPATVRHHPEQLNRVGFEGLTSSDTLFEIPNGYGGLDWHNWIATHHKFYKGTGYINSTVSGEFIAYNSSGHPATVTSTAPFDLVSVQIGLAWPAAEDGTVSISAWRGETLAYRDVFSASTRYSTLYQADFRAITRVEFRTSHYWQLVIDNLIYSARP